MIIKAFTLSTVSFEGLPQNISKSTYPCLFSSYIFHQFQKRFLGTENLKDNLNDEEMDLGWIYPVSIFAEGHRAGCGDLSVVCFSFPMFADKRET